MKEKKRLSLFPLVRMSPRPTKDPGIFRAETNGQRRVIGEVYSPCLPFNAEPSGAKGNGLAELPSVCLALPSPLPSRGSISLVQNRVVLLPPPWTILSLPSIPPWPSKLVFYCCHFALDNLCPPPIDIFFDFGFLTGLRSYVEIASHKRVFPSLLFLINDIVAHLFCTLVKTPSSFSYLHPLSPLSFVPFVPFLPSLSFPSTSFPFFLTHPNIPS